MDYQDTKGVITGDTYQYVDARDIAYFVGLSLKKIGTDALKKYEVFNVATDTRFAPDSKSFYDRAFPYLKDMTANLGDHEGLLSIRKAKELLGYEPVHLEKVTECCRPATAGGLLGNSGTGDCLPARVRG